MPGRDEERFRVELASPILLRCRILSGKPIPGNLAACVPLAEPLLGSWVEIFSQNRTNTLALRGEI
jgi:hypothetical protein